MEIIAATNDARIDECRGFGWHAGTYPAGERPVNNRLPLKIREADVAVREKGETPALSNRDLGDFAPLAADRNLRAEHEQLRAVSDALAAGENLFSDGCD